MATTQSPSTATPRAARKAERRAQLLEAAATLFAERGFASVRLEDLGAAVGISGPAVYRHFSGKDAVLVELLVGISEFLLAGGRAVARKDLSPRDAAEELIDLHLDFAFTSPALIRVQDRDLGSLPDSARRVVRRTQREYVEIWVRALCAADETLSEADARVKAHAVFGLINSTPYSAGKRLSRTTRPVLRAMAVGAVGLADPA